MRTQIVAALVFVCAALFTTARISGQLAGARVTFTNEQVQAGRAVYDASCASCHGRSLSDGIAPSLVGRTFKVRWNGQSPAGLRDYLRRQMPPGQADVLTNQQYTDVVALLLKENGYSATEVALSSDDKPVVGMRLEFAGTRWSSGGSLALDVTLPAWPKGPDPLQRMTPVTDDMLKNPSPGDWLTWRRTPDGLGFSPLTEIKANNVADLKLVWSHTLAPGPNPATPLAHDGVLFVPSAGNNVDALEAKTGELLWTYKPEGGVGGGSNRSIALYGDKLYLMLGRTSVGALDVRTGKLLWEASQPGTMLGDSIDWPPIS